MTAEQFVSRLGMNAKARATPNGFRACCPAHEDKTPSLGVSTGNDGRLLIHCFAGCPTDSVLAAVGLKEADLFQGDKGDVIALSPKSQVVTHYDYKDESGNLLFQVERREPKDFRQRKPDGNGGFDYSVKGVRQVPYRLPQLLAQVNAGAPVLVCEGEKDCNAAAEAYLTATSNAGGAGKWKAEFAEHFKDATVVIIADKDKPGREHAQQVAANLAPVAKRVCVIELPDLNGAKVKDLADYIAAGGNAADALEIAAKAVQWTPQAATDALPGNEDEPGAAGVINELPPIVDAADFVATPRPAPPELVQGILHQGSKLVLGGGSKSFKTWQLLDLGLSVAHGKPWLGLPTQGGPVLYINFEIQDYAWQKRIQAVAEAKGIAIQPSRFLLWNLRGKAADYKTLLPAIRERVADMGLALMILDPVYKLYGSADENSARDIAGLLNGLESLAVETGAATAFGAHFSKGNQAGREAMDRISGSGVFARDPDSILIFTRHEEDGAFTVDPILRNFAPVDPFAVRWQFPLMQRDDGLDPSKLKQVAGRAKEHDPKTLLLAILDTSDGNPVSVSQWAHKANINRQTLQGYLGSMRERGFIATVGEGSGVRRYITQKGIDHANS